VSSFVCSFLCLICFSITYSLCCISWSSFKGSCDWVLHVEPCYPAQTVFLYWLLFILSVFYNQNKWWWWWWWWWWWLVTIPVDSLMIVVSAILVLSYRQTDRQTDRFTHRRGWTPYSSDYRRRKQLENAPQNLRFEDENRKKIERKC